MRVTLQRANEIIERSGVNDMRWPGRVFASREGGEKDDHVTITAANYKARVLLECQATHQVEKIKAMIRFSY